MIITPWHYNIITNMPLPDFITPQDFAEFTNAKFGVNDNRITANIPAASEAIRKYCGWHVAPNLVCETVYNICDLRDAFVGNDLVVQLPATFVTGVEKILLDAKLNEGVYEGETADDFDLDTSCGLLRIYDVGSRDRKSKIFIRYSAGYSLEQVHTIKELVSNLVTHALVNPYGVSSEAAGGVSVSYSAIWASAANSTTLTADSRELLDAYKVKGVY